MVTNNFHRTLQRTARRRDCVCVRAEQFSYVAESQAIKQRRMNHQVTTYQRYRAMSRLIRESCSSLDVKCIYPGRGFSFLHSLSNGLGAAKSVVNINGRVLLGKFFSPINLVNERIFADLYDISATHLDGSGPAIAITCIPWQIQCRLHRTTKCRWNTSWDGVTS